MTMFISFQQAVKQNKENKYMTMQSKSDFIYENMSIFKNRSR